jgi:acetyltransferase
MDLLDAYGIPIPRSTVTSSPDEAVTAARTIGPPVAMKIVSPDILHKTDIGGVKVGVSLDAVEQTFEDLLTRAKRYQPDASILGVQVQEVVDTDAGVETILGSSRDPQFGPLVVFGLGGVFVEIMEDVASRVAPLSEREARTMTESINAAPLLRGARNQPAVDIEAVVTTICRLSLLVTDFPSILELDINPLIASPAGVTAVDLRLTIDPNQPVTRQQA